MAKQINELQGIKDDIMETFMLSNIRKWINIYLLKYLKLWNKKYNIETMKQEI